MLFIAHSGADCLSRAYFFAFSAADTFGIIGVFHRIAAHIAGLCTGSAAEAFIRIDPITKNGDRIEYGVDSAEGANIFAEGAIDDQGQEHDARKQDKLPCIEPAESTAQAFVEQHKRNSAFKCSDRAQQLAEIWRTLTQNVHKEHGQEYDKHNKNDIFELSQQSVAAEAFYFFGEGNFVKQLLNKAEGTKPAADKAADQCADEHKKTGHIKGKFEIPAPNDCLHGADWAGTRGSRAGIAVESRNTQIFQLAVIYFALGKSQKIAVCKQSPDSLKTMARPLAFSVFSFLFLSQFQYTPGKC